ncbi:hypothetical protein PACTADRAFT_51813 [Pachysolen tannophilus NRRL Y-2460]|uniref:Uncharacterized protein n=1 Tax=Pachysolen tannophilus NRRL Y-2460 TaxID=669874 RepID=A0A1E4TN59_PACTA|nr:hypothetical protein PACTADRAFT_51813 [Pachysolen tannophilus NRRL Y-2460]
MQATVLSAAYSQLGSMLIVKAARLEKIYNQEKSKISKEENDKFLKEISDIERMASQYLYISGAFGNSMAAENAQGLNPYSKLCGNMVRESLLNDILGKS